MKEITPEQIRAYRAAQIQNDAGVLGTIEGPLADYARDTTAALMRVEFRLDHQFTAESFTSNVFCAECKGADPRHYFIESDWLAAADKLLRGELWAP